MKEDDLIKQTAHTIGDFIEYWGFKHIHGRIWAMIYLAERPISTPQIVKSLGVSKGLVSIGINELLEYGLIEAGEKASHGAQTYLANDNIAAVIRKVLREREMELLSKTANKLSQLKSLSPYEAEEINLSVERLDDLIDLTKASYQLLSTFVSQDTRSVKDWMRLLMSTIKMRKKIKTQN